ncbi:MFS transporter [Stenotrophomonas sp. 24(2023)]|uniref:MFS transporter n=1 Tax=Stenotrophomonas sp. 24(2023) TaxID=3068324 RepID=UPI0027DF74E4|nr:MFS transporter [Stenotrophomonas sp. 24(2023)]WMJ69256.1 MFS transporter [Stenotrophomonas sp. 24(2023)]
MNTASPRTDRRELALLAAILLIAACLRAPFTGLPPALGLIATDLRLSTGLAGAIITLPLLAFALLSPLVAALARRQGLERTLTAGLVILAVGIALRSAGAAAALFVGTAVIGIGITVGNVLLPSLIKRSFPNSITPLTGAYALTMGIAATAGSAVVVPLSTAWGWPAALASFIVLPLVALAAWLPQLRQPAATAPTAAASTPEPRLWRSPLAWQVTLFLGLNSLLSYIAIGWLPAMLVEAGHSQAQTGSLHGVLQLAIAVPGLVIGPLVRRLRDQRLAAALSAACMAGGFLGLLLAPAQAIAWCALLGVGSGTGFILGLAFVGLRTRTTAQAVALSGMAQCVGYLLAASGPISMGALHDAAGSWQWPLLLCTGLALLEGSIGLLAGRDRRIGDAAPAPAPAANALPPQQA